MIILLLLSAVTCVASAQDGETTPVMDQMGNISGKLTVLYNNTVNLTEGNFTFTPENSNQTYRASNFTDIGALNATGLRYNVSVIQDANMTNVVLEGIEGIRNNNTTGEIWFVYINGEPADENFGINPVADGDNLSFWYATEQDGEAAIENATYVASVTVALKEGIGPQPKPRQNLTVLYNNTVNLTRGNFTFRPESSTQTYQVDNLTGLGALNATGLNFTASLMQDMTGNMTGNMTPSFSLQSVEGIRNNNITGEMWFIYINGAPAEDNLGMNNVTDGDNLSFWYTTEMGGEAAIENATYVVNVTVSAEKRSDLIQKAETQQNLSIFVNAVEAANLTETLREEGPYTVFAPSNEAFNQLSGETISESMNDTEMLRRVLSYHVAEGRFTKEVLASTDNITSIQGDVLQVNTTDGNITIEDANITQITLASNGVLCVIDRVLIPPENGTPSDGQEELIEIYNDTVNLTRGNFTFRPENSTQTYQMNNLTDLGALNATGLDFNVSVMQNITGNVTGNMTGTQTGLTQTQTAQTQTTNITQTQTANMTQTGTTAETQTGNMTPQFMLQDIEGISNDNTTGEMWFTYINGVPANRSFGMNNVTNGTNISFWYTTEQDGKAAIENATFVANVTVAITAPASGDNQTGGNQTGDKQIGGNQTENRTIVQAAQNQTNLSTFVNVVQTANLTQTLNTGNYTIFAPSNEAFNKLPPATRNELMNNTSQLRQVLSYHVVSGKLTREQLASMNNVTDVGGNVLQINVVQNNIMIQNVNITQITVVNNGTICVIDKVLIPPGSGIGSNETGGTPDVNQTGGNQTGIWHFFSIPFEANNTSVSYLLSGVNYTSLSYYNASSKRFENVSKIEPLKAYWINVPNGTQFNASRQFASVGKRPVAVPPSLKVYPGWNALGLPVNITVPAKVAFITLDSSINSSNNSLNNSSNTSSFVKVIGPWIPGNNTTGYYQYVGYNGFNGTISENQVGADVFQVRPFEGYWVFVEQEDLYA